MGLFNTIQLISESTEHQKYTVHLSWQSLQQLEHCSEYQPLTQVCCWCIGEYGAMLRESCPDLGTGPVTESEVIGWYRHKTPKRYLNEAFCCYFLCKKKK